MGGFLGKFIGGSIGGPLGESARKFVDKQGGEFTTLFDPGDLLGRQKKKEKRRLRAIEEKRRRLELSKQGAQTIRDAQIERAKLLQLGENRGVGDTSAILGGLGSVQSQAGANLGFANQIFAFQQQSQSRLNKLERLESRTKLAMTVGTFFLGGIGGAVAGAASSSSAEGTGTVSNDSFRGIGS